jgi:large subunit ribosomal protein L6
MQGSQRSIKIPEGVDVQVKDGLVSVKGPLGSLSRDFKHAGVSISKRDDGEILVSVGGAGRKAESILGTIAQHIENMMLGTTKGFQCKMKVVYSHFPITLKVDGDRIMIRNFIGERAPREAKVEGRDTKVKIDGENVTLEGIDVEKVMQTAANMETATRIIAKDQRVFLDGIYVVEKGLLIG